MSRASLRAAARPSREAPTPAYRHDIDGLRALAIALVVVYHVWLGRVSGGVDVFLMISAFFLTASFVRRIESGRALSLGPFWIRRFCRLLPAAAITIIGVLLVAWAVFPPSWWQDIWAQSWASLFYVQNWELAASSVDYYSRTDASPLQHFWSLSIQGQVFIVWPVVVLIGAFIARRTRWSIRVILGVLFGAIFLTSLVHSIIVTAEHQQYAYFDTFARLWEFALGSLLALWMPDLRRWPRFAAVLAWVGILGLVLCGIVIDVQGGFPGYLALWPTLCAAAVIVAGVHAPAGGPWRFLQSAPLRTVGKSAYALYLVHWPVLITWMLVAQVDEVDLWAGLAIIGISWVLAVILSTGVERPLRDARAVARSPRLGAALIAACIALVAVPLATWQVFEAQRAAAAEATAADLNPGAAILLGDTPVELPPATILPLGSDIDDEWVALDRACTGLRVPLDPVLGGTCLETATTDPEATILVIGDSHAQQAAGIIAPLAEEGNWRIISLVKGSCTLALDEPAPPWVDGCDEWRAAAIEYAKRLEPDAVVTIGTAAEPDGPGERLLPGIERAIESIEESGTPVVVLRDNPRSERNLFRCLERHGVDAERCIMERDAALAESNPAEVLERTRVAVVDLTDYICPDGLCPSAIGNVAVYLDSNHITQRYARSMAPAFEEALSTTPWWPSNRPLP